MIWMAAKDGTKWSL